MAGCISRAENADMRLTSLTKSVLRNGEWISIPLRQPRPQRNDRPYENLRSISPLILLPPPVLKDRREPSSLGPTGWRRNKIPAPPSERQRNSCPHWPCRGGLTSAAHCGKFARTDFTKTGFAAAGTRARAKRVRGGLNVAACSSAAHGLLEGPILSGSPSHPLHPNARLVASGTRGGPRGRFCRGFWGQGVCWSCGRTGRSGRQSAPSGARARHRPSCLRPHHRPRQLETSAGSSLMR
jgi:hypothetical protein